MRRFLLLTVLAAGAGASAETAGTPTFSKDIAAILQHNCQGCHRPGEAAPMPLLTYRQARPWAKAIAEAVRLRKMPPWGADPQFGRFTNDRSLSQKDRETLLAWVDGGAPEGDPDGLPKPMEFVDGWNIGVPDMVIEMPEAFQVSASGTIDYQYVIVPLHFTEDRWVQAAEIRPGNRALVHHVLAFLREPGSKWMPGQKPGEVFVPDRDSKGEFQPFQGDMLTGFTPGTPAVQLEPGQAHLVKAGSDVVLQLHYAANGKAGQDRSKLGVVFAKEPPRERVLTLSAINRRFTIPAGDPNYQVESQFELGHDARLISLMPHMHLRGKDFEYRLTYPSGETQTILRVPHYDFGWQLVYSVLDGIALPKGTKISCTAHFDNSPNNPNNPDPTRNVKWGDQSWDEMMNGFFDLAFPPDLDPKLLRPEKKAPPKVGDGN